MPLIPIIAAIVATKAIGAAANIYGQRKAAKAYEQEGHMEAEIFGRNADVAEEMAADALARGREAEMRQHFKMRTLTGGQRSAFSGQGVVVDTGSAQQVVQSDYRTGQFDLLQIKENAAREALGFERQADIFRRQGDLARVAGRNRAKQERYKTLSTLAEFGGDMFSLYRGRNG